MTFQIRALNGQDFEQYFHMDDAQLHAHKAIRMTVKETPGTPCRVSLEDAEVGEEVILINCQHQAGDSPFQASHAVFVRTNANQARLRTGEVPKLMRHRLMSVRAFDKNHMMIDADAVEGTQLEPVIESFLNNETVDYIHLHYAKPGCFAARVTRS